MASEEVVPRGSSCQQCLYLACEDRLLQEHLDLHEAHQEGQAKEVPDEPQHFKNRPGHVPQCLSAPPGSPSAHIAHQFTGSRMVPCWYCMKSLPPDEPSGSQSVNDTPLAPPRGQHVRYQQDPRPHFGIAFSSRSTALPLWGNEGQRDKGWAGGQEETAAMCPNCHLALPIDTLRWHEAKCLLFQGWKVCAGSKLHQGNRDKSASGSVKIFTKEQ